MNWEAIGAAGETIGAMTVLITLIYLARQMKQNNALMREQASYNMLQNQLSYYDGMAREPRLVNIVYDIPESDLEATERAKAESPATAAFFRWPWASLRTQEAILSEEELPIAGFRREWDRAKFLPHWQEQKYMLHPEFVSFVERNIVIREEDT